MKKKMMALVLAGAMVLSLCACSGSAEDKSSAAAETAETEATEAESSDDAAEATETAVSGKIAMITDSGDITDESFNQITWEACQAYGQAHGVETEYYKPAADSDEERINSVDLAVAEGANVIVMPGYLFGAAIAEQQSTYPDVTFIAVDVTEGDIVNLSGEAVPLEKNVYVCSFQEEQAGYLAGYAAVKEGYTKLGFLGGIAVPAVIRYGYGYIQGINAAAEELGVDVDVKYYYGGQFYGSDAITARMEGWYGNGTEVVFACGGGIWTSANDAAKEHDGKVIGVDVDQRPAIGDTCITSAMKGLASAVNSALDAYFSGDFSAYAGKSEQLGLAQGDYIGLPTDGDSWTFTTFTKDEYTSVLAGITDGSIVVSNDTENQPEVGAHVTVEYIE